MHAPNNTPQTSRIHDNLPPAHNTNWKEEVEWNSRWNEYKSECESFYANNNFSFVGKFVCKLKLKL